MENTKERSRLGGNGHIKLPQDKAKAEVQLIGPKKASDWLESNKDNRELKSAVVNKYASIMEGGQWELSNDAICFTQSGHLINGQHRLNAVIRSETTQPFIVARGLSREAFKWMDQPRKRTLSQALKMEGYKNSRTLSSVARLVYTMERGVSFRNSVPVRDGVKLVKHHHPEIADSASSIRRYNDQVTGVWRPSTIGFIHFVLRFYSHDLAESFCEAVATGLGLNERNDPRHQLRTRLQNEAVNEAERIDRKIEIALTIKAAKKYISDDWVKMLKWAPGGNEPFPEVPFAEDYPFYHG